jgi:hypothetical protein
MAGQSVLITMRSLAMIAAQFKYFQTMSSIKQDAISFSPDRKALVGDLK